MYPKIQMYPTPTTHILPEAVCYRLASARFAVRLLPIHRSTVVTELRGEAQSTPNNSLPPPYDGYRPTTEFGGSTLNGS